MLKLKLVLIVFMLLSPTAILSLAQDTQQPYAVEVFYDSKGIPMVLVPAGEFKGGIELDEAVQQCLSFIENEGFPPYDPKIVCDKDFIRTTRGEPFSIDLQAFYMDQYEVSRSDYLACTKVDVCSKEPLENFPHESLDTLPIQYTTYIDASIYCAWREARLPYLIEWEYAAAGPENLTYVWGNEFKGNLTNHCDVNCKVLGDGASDSIWDDGYSEVGPVDAFKEDRSWVGIYNLGGNVSEWVNTTPRPDEPGYNLMRLIKGGSFGSYPYQTATWYSEVRTVGLGQSSIGFRCVRTTKL